MSLSMTDSDASTLFPEEDTTLFTVADSSAIDAEESARGFSSDWVSRPSSSSSSSLSGLNILGPADDLEYETDPNLGNWDDDTRWLTADSGSDFGSDAAPLDEVSSSCVGDDDNSSSSTLSTYFGKTAKKVRRADSGPMCVKNNEFPASSSNINFPDLTHLEQPGSEAKQRPEVGIDKYLQDNNICPPQQRQHVCCSGPGIEDYPFLGLYQHVQNCEPCKLSSFLSSPIEIVICIVRVRQQTRFYSANRMLFTRRVFGLLKSNIGVLLRGSNPIFSGAYTYTTSFVY